MECFEKAEAVETRCYAPAERVLARRSVALIVDCPEVVSGIRPSKFRIVYSFLEDVPCAGGGRRKKVERLEEGLC